eukprot:11494894-Ditylum_brightwellii.AAC.1
MKIDHKILKLANLLNNEKKLSLLDYQTYKLGTNRKDEKSAFYNLVIKGQDIQDGDAAYLLVFKNEEVSQETKDGPSFTKCLGAVTEHVFPKKAYKTQKK